VPLAAVGGGEFLPGGGGFDEFGPLDSLGGRGRLVGPGLLEEDHEASVVAVDGGVSEVSPDYESEAGKQVV